MIPFDAARRSDKISAGPQSQILDGSSWEDSQRMRDAHVSGTGEHLIVVGAASKGIIEREFQHNAQIYRQLYQPNPFASETDEDLEKYRREVEMKMRKERGELDPYPATSPIRRGDVSPPHSAESCSLMQLKPDMSGSLTQETTFDASSNRTTTRLTEKKPSGVSSIGGYFRRVRSERPSANRSHETSNLNGEREHTAGSEDEDKKEKKKKKGFKTPSFLKRGKKEKKNKSAHGGEEEEEEE